MKAFNEIVEERDRVETDINKLNREIEDMKIRIQRRNEEISKLTEKLSEYDLIIKTLSPLFKEEQDD